MILGSKLLFQRKRLMVFWLGWHPGLKKFLLQRGVAVSTFVIGPIEIIWTAKGVVLTPDP